MSFERAVRWLRCPHCLGELSVGERSLVCAAGHAFDIARQGYVNLLARPTKLSADSADMVGERADFLAAGHYAPLRAALARAARQVDFSAPDRVVADLGGGTGYYLGGVLESLPDADGVLFDLSKFAVRRAAKAHPRVTAAVADVWQPLPVRTGAVSLALNVFAPRNGPELRRVLDPAGALLVVSPEPDHLAELTELLGLLRVAETKLERLVARLAPDFALHSTEQVRQTMELDHQSAIRLVAMGPNAHHQDLPRLAGRVKELPTPVRVTLGVRMSVFHPLP